MSLNPEHVGFVLGYTYSAYRHVRLGPGRSIWGHFPVFWAGKGEGKENRGGIRKEEGDRESQSSQELLAQAR